MRAHAARSTTWRDALRRLCADWLFLHGHVGVIALSRASDDEGSAPRTSAARDQTRPDTQPERARRLWRMP